LARLNAASERIFSLGPFVLLRFFTFDLLPGDPPDAVAFLVAVDANGSPLSFWNLVSISEHDALRAALLDPSSNHNRLLSWTDVKESTR